MKPNTGKPKPAQPQRPNQLTMRLFAPGMTVMHRAGLGGLVCTLDYIERAWHAGAILDDDVPGGPWSHGQPPWDIDEQTVTLRFGAPEAAGGYLKRLFALAFQIKDGLIYLPGQYGAVPPSLAVRTELQNSLTLTFLQHGKTRKSSQDSTTFQVDVDGSGMPMSFEYKRCSWYKHQDGWQDLWDEKRAALSNKAVEVIGPLNPGAVVRHVAFSKDTTIADRADLILPLYFALVGCVSLAVNRGVGILLVPDLVDLQTFAADRPSMTPSSPLECRVTGAGDAVLQTVHRLRLRSLALLAQLPGCYGVRLQATSWASQQKSRVHSTSIELDDGAPLVVVRNDDPLERTDRSARGSLRFQPVGSSGDELLFDRFEVALAELPPKVVVRRSVETKGRGKNKQVAEKAEAFRVDSVVRPLIAENLARGQPWYERFVDLMTKLDPNGNPFREKVLFEKKGLHAMIENPDMWDDEGEAAIVQAVHEALRNRYGRIAEENKGSPVTMKRRFGGEYDRWRLAFAGSKTADQLRATMCDLFSRAGNNAVLRESWRKVLPFLTTRWQLARDLALLALASYQGRGPDGESGVKISETVEQAGEDQ